MISKKSFKYALFTAIAGYFAADTLNTVAYAQSPNHYRGRACIMKVNPFCEALGWRIGDCANARYTPPNVFGSSDTTRLSLHWTNYAQNWTSFESVLGNVYKTANFTAIGRSGTQINDSRTEWRVLLNQPGNFSTEWIHSVIDIFRFDDFGAGSGSSSLCTVRLRLTGVKHPIPVPASAPAAGQVPSLGNSNTAPTE